MTSGMNPTQNSGSASRRTVTAFFDSRADADEAVSRLHSAGIARDSIRLVPGNEGNDDTADRSRTPSLGEASVGFWDSLRDLFLPDEDRHTYAEGLRRGGYLVTVSATDSEYERALDILDDEGTIDIDERADSWRAEGWSGVSTSDALSGSTANLPSGSSARTAGSSMGDASSSGSAGLRGTSGDTGRMTGERDQVIPVAEERLNVGKRDVSHGRVRVRSYVVETPVREQVSLRQEHVEVERRPVDRATTSAEDAFQERTIEMDERSEEAVVSKEARVKEELVVKKDVEQRTKTVSDTVRSTEVDVEDERGNRITGTGAKDRRS
jgi:uncharacterized protein (TIGR02271 family)